MALSFISVAIIVERSFYFARQHFAGADQVVLQLLESNPGAVQSKLAGARGIQAEVIRIAIANPGANLEPVAEVIAATASRERKYYERGLAFLGTVGSEAPFVSLFETVLGYHQGFPIDIKLAALTGTVLSSTAKTGKSGKLPALGSAPRARSTSWPTKPLAWRLCSGKAAARRPTQRLPARRRALLIPRSFSAPAVVRTKNWRLVHAPRLYIRGMTLREIATLGF